MMKRKTRNLIQDSVASTVAIFLGLVITFPLIYCLFGAFKTPHEFLTPTLLPGSFAYLGNFKEALEKGNLIRYTFNSFIVAFFGTSIRLVFSILAAYAFAYYDFKFKSLWFFLILGTMMIPADVLLATNYLTVSKLRLLNSYLGVMVVSFVSAAQMFMLRQRFKSVPKDMREAAQIDGYGDISYMINVLIPISKPVITTLFVHSFITLWNAYLWPLIITASSPNMRTIMVGITKLNSWEDENYQLVLAGVCISLIPSLILFIIMRRNMRKGGMDGALVG
ncbi:MAG: carbohydrate ABC transporter permease [Spirochaetota bacterium]